MRLAFSRNEPTTICRCFAVGSSTSLPSGNFWAAKVDSGFRQRQHLAQHAGQGLAHLRLCTYAAQWTGGDSCKQHRLVREATGEGRAGEPVERVFQHTGYTVVELWQSDDDSVALGNQGTASEHGFRAVGGIQILIIKRNVCDIDAVELGSFRQKVGHGSKEASRIGVVAQAAANACDLQGFGHFRFSCVREDEGAAKRFPTGDFPDEPASRSDWILTTTP